VYEVPQQTTQAMTIRWIDDRFGVVTLCDLGV
jgi:hypothetical protein